MFCQISLFTSRFYLEGTTLVISLTIYRFYPFKMFSSKNLSGAQHTHAFSRLWTMWTDPLSAFRWRQLAESAPCISLLLFSSNQWCWMQMEAACRQEPSLTSVNTALHPSEALITYADMSSFTQVSQYAPLWRSYFSSKSLIMWSFTHKQWRKHCYYWTEETDTDVIVLACKVYPTVPSHSSLCTC